MTHDREDFTEDTTTHKFVEKVAAFLATTTEAERRAFRLILDALDPQGAVLAGSAAAVGPAVEVSVDTSSDRPRTEERVGALLTVLNVLGWPIATASGVVMMAKNLGLL